VSIFISYITGNFLLFQRRIKEDFGQPYPQPVVLSSSEVQRVEGLLLCIKTKKLERIKGKIEENGFNDLLPEISGFYSD